jgi:Arc/MetJ-type ribon-helix-helix transcriptional regulator
MYMTKRKERLTVTVDAELLAAANGAVERGSADSLSAWVNEALAARAERDEKLAALSDLIAEYEAEHGEITEADIAARHRADREAAIVVRGRVPDELLELDRRNRGTS